MTLLYILTLTYLKNQFFYFTKQPMNLKFRFLGYWNRPTPTQDLRRQNNNDKGFRMTPCLPCPPAIDRRRRPSLTTVYVGRDRVGEVA